MAWISDIFFYKESKSKKKRRKKYMFVFGLGEGGGEGGGSVFGVGGFTKKPNLYNFFCRGGGGGMEDGKG